MIEKDLQKYAEDNWGGYMQSVTELSARDDGAGSLVESGAVMYNFDAITESLSPPGKQPASVDALAVSAKAVDLIEFKTGFRRRITKENYNEDLLRCERISGNVCQEYRDLLFKEQEKEVEVLRAAMRDKAVESYITLEKMILPLCADADVHIPLRLTAVIDFAPDEGIEDTLAELACAAPDDNPFTSLRSSLQRLTGLCDAAGERYYFDEISVLSAEDFLQKQRLSS